MFLGIPGPAWALAWPWPALPGPWSWAGLGPGLARLSGLARAPDAGLGQAWPARPRAEASRTIYNDFKLPINRTCGRYVKALQDLRQFLPIIAPCLHLAQSTYVGGGLVRNMGNL